MTRIGVIGLGRMGSAIAARLAGQGLAVCGWTRSGLCTGRAEALGIARATDLADLVARSDVIVTSLYDTGAVVEILERLLEVDLSGRLIIETSTIAPSALRDRAERFAAARAGLVDAPISGGPDLVAAGRCGVFVGGDALAGPQAVALLAALSGGVAHVGPLGAGQVMKALNNSLMQVYLDAFTQLLPGARAAGLSLETVLDLLQASPAGLPFLAQRREKILGVDQTIGFPLDGIAKDNAVFRAIFAGFGVESAALRLAGAALERHLADGLGGEDPAALIARAYGTQDRSATTPKPPSAGTDIAKQ